MKEKLQRLEFGLTPSCKGRFYLDGIATIKAEELDPKLQSVFLALEKSLAEGIAELYRQSRTATNESFYQNPEVRFLTSAYELFLCELCRTPEELFATVDAETLAERILPLEGRQRLIESVPFMIGAEYMTPELLASIVASWSETVLSYARSEANGFERFLRERAPGWRGVGSVWFHLAENKKNDDRPFCFLATFTTDLSSTGRIRHKPLGAALTEYAGAKNRNALQKILAPIRVAEQKSPLLREMVKNGEIYAPNFWTVERTYEFLCSSVLFEESGIKVSLPDWWKKQARPKIQVKIGEKKTCVGKDSLLDFQVSVAYEGKTLTDDEIQTLLASEGGLVSLRGEWVEADGNKLKEALSHWKELQEECAQGIDFLEGMRLLAGAPKNFAPREATEDDDQTEIKLGKSLEKTLRQARSFRETDYRASLAPLKATLRPYQREGLAWLRFGTSLGLGVCLADDMGLGKTIQIIALLLLIRDARNAKKKKSTPPSLLILPASLLGNWKSELERFAPTLSVWFDHPSINDSLRKNREISLDDRIPNDCDLVVTTYGTIHRNPDYAKRTWNLVVLDEAQAIKNPGTQQTRQVKKLKGTARIALTGTPLENRLSDLWSIFDFLNPGYLGSEKAFLKWSKSLSENEGEGYRTLRKLVSPLILRRLKTDKKIVSDLPEKIETTTFAFLSKEQTALYAALVNELKNALATTDGIRRLGLVLSYLMKFKQVCNHPSLYRGVAEYDPAKSGKFTRLAELCGKIAERREKALIFTQFRETVDPLNEFLSDVFGRPGLTLHGGTAIGKRKSLVDAFQSEDGPPYFILSLKAGGTGLNLTAASHVVHFDRWWNPAVENQATDRAFRIGQTKNVLVHKLVCRGTVEERIDAMIAEKRNLAEKVLAQDTEKTLTEMNDEEIMKFVALDENFFEED